MDLVVNCSRFPQAGETVLGTAFQTVPGGKGANQAVQAARLGTEVTLIGKVGNDAYGQELIRSVTAAGIHTDYISKSTVSPTAIGNVQVELNGRECENRIIVVPGANAELTYHDIAFLEDTIGFYDMLMLQMEIPMAVNRAAARLAFEAGVPVMLNPAPAAPLPPDLLQTVTYLSPNEQEAQMLTGMPTDNQADLKRLTRRFLRQGVKHTVLTLGKKGALFSDPTLFILRPCVDTAPPIDTTGAGDSFIGAFCAAVCRGMQPADALTFANTAASITVSRAGAQISLPFLREVAAAIQNTGIGLSQADALSVLFPDA